ncbi:MAG: DUF1501 domain-containing protein [Planctomycetota bacterium]
MEPLNGPLSGSPLSRRALLRLGARGALAGLGLGCGLGWPRRALAGGDDPPASSLIVLWLDGGASQLETWDPHPGTATGGPTKAIDTKQRGVRFAEGLPRLAERADELAVLRSILTKEGEHQRGRYLMRTGFPMVATVQHPALSASVAHELRRERVQIPTHVSFLSPNPPRGGYLGARWDAFKVGDPRHPVPDLIPPVGKARFERRRGGLELLERGFRRGREARVEDTQHGALLAQAKEMMDSPQVEAFDVAREPAAVREAYGDTPFGRACLAARRLVEVGVPSIEVTLPGWDTHADHFELSRPNLDALDRGFSALLDDLAQRQLLDRTLVLCASEFGRTPRINPLDGRDHWTRGFSLALAGGGLRVGQTLGATDPEGERPPSDPIEPRDVCATILRQLGIEGSQVFETPQGRPIKLNEGKPLKQLIG